MPKATLKSFSDLAQERASQIRNCANEPELLSWLDAVFFEKFDTLDERAGKAKTWCSTVARKHMLREGASEPFLPQPEALAAGAAWIRKAASEGKPLTTLCLEPAERELFSAILDWMRSTSGPALGSDWSKISVAQAKAAELAWVDAMAKAAAKKDLDAADAVGTELFAALGPSSGPREAARASGSEWAGWRWVEVASADALDREGSMMRHCVGSYAEDVASGRKRIYSLRDPSNTPKLTIEAKGSVLVQIKAFANASCPAEMRPAVASFAKAFEADAAARGLGVASASEELGLAGVGSMPGLGLVVGRLSVEQEYTLAVWVSEASEGGVRGEAAERRLEALAPGLAGLGLEENLTEMLRFSSKASRKEALFAAARNGCAGCVRLLIEVSDAKAEDSMALSFAAENGHAECVAMLIPVSDPKAGGSRALNWAAEVGHPECVKILISVSDPKSNNSKALYEAAEHGNAACVKLLIPVSDPKVRESQALTAAALNGHVECVKLLIPVSDAKDANSQGLYWAAFYGHTKCVEQLIPVCGPKAEALRAAIEGGSVDCVELLLPFCDPMEQSFDGLTAHDLALQEGRAEVAAIIGRFIKQEREVEKLPSILLTKWKKERADGAPKSEREPKGEQLSQ